MADIAIHAPCRRDADARNHHAHILLTMRAIDGDGFGAKVRAWNDTALLEQWRALWAEHVNRALEDAGETCARRSPQPRGAGHRARAANPSRPRGRGTRRARYRDRPRRVAQEIEAINAALAEIERQASPATPPGHDQVAAQRSGGILTAFRTAARRVWERVERRPAACAVMASSDG